MTKVFIDGREGTTGLKTGTTSTAKYCLSATAQRNGLELVAVIMSADSTADRFNGAKKLLDYGFANFASFSPDVKELDDITVRGGIRESVAIGYSPVSVILPKNKLSKADETIELVPFIDAPVKCGDIVGEIIYSVNGEIIARSDIYAKDDIKKAGYTDIISKIFKKLIMLK